MSEWIKTSTKHPEDNQSVWVYNWHQKKVQLATWDEYAGWVSDMVGIGEYLSHWMPAEIPKPPETEEK